MHKRLSFILASCVPVLFLSCRQAPKPPPAVIKDARGIELYSPPQPRPLAAVAGRRRLLAAVPRGVPGDLYADIVLGQPDFATIAPNEVVSYRLNTPSGVKENPSKTHAWIWDLGNNRLLRLDLTSGKADRVLGQPNFSSSACNGDSGYQGYPDLAPASASSLCGLDESVLSPQESVNATQMDFDSAGAMYVGDVMNNRVLKYCNPDIDVAACDVWGQPDFASRLPATWDIATTAPTNRSLRRPQAVAIDPATGTLAVADTLNSRVLLDTNLDHQWDVVLGPKDFTTGGYYAWEAGLSTVGFPTGLAFWNGALYVSSASRILKFQPPFSIGMTGEVFISGFQTGTVNVDPRGRGLWVNERMVGGGARLYDASGTLLKHIGYPGGMFHYGGIGFDAAGNVIGAGFFSGHDVVRFVENADGSVSTQAFFNPGPTEGNSPNHISIRGYQAPDGIEVWGDQMIVAWGMGLRAYNGVSNVASWQNNRLPDVDLPLGGIRQQIAADSSGRLYVASLGGAWVEVYQLPLLATSTPFARLPQSLPVLGGGMITTWGANGIAVSPDGRFLYLADDLHNRALRIRDPLLAPQVDAVYGQLNISDTLCNRGGAVIDATTLCRPGKLSLAPTGHLYISDAGGEAEGNGRFLRFAALPSDNITPLFAPAAEKIFPKPQAAFRTGEDAANRIVAGYNPYIWISRFPGIYDDPFGSSDQPSRFLGDFTSWPQTHIFFGAGHLAQADGNRNRVLIYLSPFGTVIQPTATADVTTAVPTATNTPTDTATPLPSFTPQPPAPTPTSPPPPSTRTPKPKKTPPHKTPRP